jgi:hypothetical protein
LVFSVNSRFFLRLLGVGRSQAMAAGESKFALKRWEEILLKPEITCGK